MMWKWIWPSVGAVPINQGLDTEMFDRLDYPYSETFVREAIQNTLDARLDPSVSRSGCSVSQYSFHKCSSVPDLKATLPNCERSVMFPSDFILVC